MPYGRNMPSTRFNIRIQDVLERVIHKWKELTHSEARETVREYTEKKRAGMVSLCPL